MLLIECPYCEEKRSELEFTHGGQAHIMRPENPSALDDEQWAQYLFIRENNQGVHYERWIHTHGCGRFFNAVRDTQTDRFYMSYKASEPRPLLAQLKKAGLK